MTANDLRQKFLDFMKSKGHTIIPSASLVPENDPSVLFTTAGMIPLVPYLLGEKHPGGKRVASIQKCIRTGDIDEVGDNRHLTFFEMLGNWSFGDYFKKEAVEWSFEFLTSEKWLGLDPKRIYVSVFRGNEDISRDNESIENWQKVFKNIGIDAEVATEDAVLKNNIRIIPLGEEDNVWIAGETGPCGPNTEMYYDTRPEEGTPTGKFSDLVDNFRLIEIWNDVFMEFKKTVDGKYEKLSQQNVDTGMGMERTLAVLEGKENVFETELFQPIFEKIEEISGKKYEGNEKSFRIIADHIKAATFIISEGVAPLNVGRGYVLRRLIRRAIRYGKQFGIEENFLIQISSTVIKVYNDFYPELDKNKENIFDELEKEENKFRKTLENGLKEFNKFINNPAGHWFKREGEQDFQKSIYPNDEMVGMIFDLYQTYGFPLELVFEELRNNSINIDEDKLDKKFNEKLKKHQKLSRTASAGMFKGGLAGHSEMTVKYHTATHLLLAAIRKILGENIIQKGSNITEERLRFDFNYPEKLTPEQIGKIENLINQKISENIPVEMTEMPKEEALKLAKISFDPAKYGDKVKVYSIGDFSIELCGGPHVKNIGELGKFKIIKEESSSAGVRRIKAVLK